MQLGYFVKYSSKVISLTCCKQYIFYMELTLILQIHIFYIAFVFALNMEEM